MILYALLVSVALSTIREETLGTSSLKHLELSAATTIRWKNLFFVGDVNWYRSIADTGYDLGPYRDDRQYNWAFFPAMPLLILTGRQLLGSDLLVGLFIPSALLFGALVALYQLARELGYSDKQASFCQWCLAFFPTSYFLSFLLSEPVFLFSILMSFLLLEKKKPLWASLFFAFAGLSRATGLLLIPAFALRLWEKKLLFSWRGLIAFIATPAPTIIFSLYLYQKTGNPFAWKDIQVAWGRLERTPFDLIGDIGSTTLISGWNFYLLDSVAAIFAIAVSLWFLHKSAFAWAALIALPVLAGLSTGSVLSLARHTLVLFPIYFFLTNLNERAVLASTVALYSALTLLFSLGVTAALA